MFAHAQKQASDLRNKAQLRHKVENVEHLVRSLLYENQYSIEVSNTFTFALNKSPYVLNDVIHLW